MAKTFNKNAVIRGALRRTFARAPVKQEVLRAVRKEFPKYNKDGTRSKKDAVCYLCNVCKQYVGSTKVTVDHIESVISVDEGFVDWNTFIDRLYCGKENLQVICDPCHQEKTNRERFERTFREEQKVIDAIEHRSSDGFLNATTEELKILKRFTKKRLEKYPEPFVLRVLRLKNLKK